MMIPYINYLQKLKLLYSIFVSLDAKKDDESTDFGKYQFKFEIGDYKFNR